MGAYISNLFAGGSAEASTGGDDSRVMTFDSSDKWQKLFQSFKESDKLLVVDFSAAWCGPCRAMEPFVDRTARSFTDVEFAKIDVDKLPDVAQEFSVQAMPTFVFLKQGKEVDRLVGADKVKLEKLVCNHRS